MTLGALLALDAFDLETRDARSRKEGGQRQETVHVLTSVYRLPRGAQLPECGRPGQGNERNTAGSQRTRNRTTGVLETAAPLQREAGKHDFDARILEGEAFRVGRHAKRCGSPRPRRAQHGNGDIDSQQFCAVETRTQFRQCGSGTAAQIHHPDSVHRGRGRERQQPGRAVTLQRSAGIVAIRGASEGPCHTGSRTTHRRLE